LLPRFVLATIGLRAQDRKPLVFVYFENGLPE
jgi:hypothetical protein